MLITYLFVIIMKQGKFANFLSDNSHFVIMYESIIRPSKHFVEKSKFSTILQSNAIFFTKVSKNVHFYRIALLCKKYRVIIV